MPNAAIRRASAVPAFDALQVPIDGQARQRTRLELNTLDQHRAITIPTRLKPPLTSNLLTRAEIDTKSGRRDGSTCEEWGVFSPAERGGGAPLQGATCAPRALIRTLDWHAA